MSKDVKRVDRKLVKRGTIIDLYCDSMKFSNGNTEKWDYIHHRGAAAVVPVTEDGKLLMVRQYRNALGRFTIEIPAGGLDSLNETGIECSLRELEEETGYRSENVEWLITIRTSVALCNEQIEIYVARDLTETEQRLDTNEFVMVERYTVDELKHKIFTGEIEDAKTIAAILAYDTKYSRL